MILFDFAENEAEPTYQDFAVANGERQYDFLRSVVLASLATKKLFLSEHILKALNFHAIVCLHPNAGEYRPCPVTVGTHNPPAHFRVDSLMEDFVNTVNRNWETSDPLFLAAYVLWRLNYIHPFINGNGRTARVACYFVLCLKLGNWLPGATTLPELIKRRRPEYVAALQAADASLKAGPLNLGQLHWLLVQLIQEQLQSANDGGSTQPPQQPGTPSPSPAPSPAPVPGGIPMPEPVHNQAAPTPNEQPVDPNEIAKDQG